MVQTRRHRSLSIIFVVFSIFLGACSVKAAPFPLPENVDPSQLRVHPFSNKWLFIPAVVAADGHLAPLNNPRIAPLQSNPPQAFGKGKIYQLSVESSDSGDESPIFRFRGNQPPTGDYLILQLGKNNPGAADISPANKPSDKIIKVINDSYHPDCSDKIRSGLIPLSRAGQDLQLFFLALDGKSSIFVFENNKIKTVYRFPDQLGASLSAYADLDGKGEADTFLIRTDDTPPYFELLGLTPAGNWWRLAEPVPAN
jgi:hypothetical protein